MKQVWTILDMITWGKQYFAGKDIDSPRLTIELMLSAVVSMPRIRLYTSFDRPLSDAELAALREMVRRRVRGEPLQYILGETHFYNIVLEVNPDVLIPRPETEVLVETVVKGLLPSLLHQEMQTLRIADLGTGSGCIALALAHELAVMPALQHKEPYIEAWDISVPALNVARKNAARLRLSNVRFIQHDILHDIPSSAPIAKITEDEAHLFDLIVSNPPYIPLDDIATLQKEVRDYEPIHALTDSGDGLGFYRHFAEIFPTLLHPRGAFALEIGYGQAPEIEHIFSGCGFCVEFVQDLAGIPRVCVGRFAGL